MAPLPSLIGRFQIRSRIGQGGMGSLYLAWDPTLEREIAIKLLRDDNDELRERFSREARSVARLRHPRIVMIYDVGEHDGQPFIAMEYINGQTLADVIRAAPVLAVVRKIQLIEELCDGLGFAHRMGIVHRDIKPANIMIDEEGGLKILDFGIARIGPGMTQAGMLIGTLNYMSPEQVTGKPVDSRSDIFAVGAVLYELLAYRQAFAGGLDSGILHKIEHQQPEPLETLCPGLDSELIQIVYRALEKEADARYQDLPAMGRDLLRVRQRLDASAPVPTVAVRVGEVPTLQRRREPNREALERRRTAQIEAFLTAAEDAFAAGDYELAIARSEEALLLDSENVRAADLLDHARTALEGRQAGEWLDRAQEHLDRADFGNALELAQKALALHTSPRAQDLLRAIEQAREEQARQRERAERLERARVLAQELLHDRRLEEAVAAADEALAIDEDDARALALRQRAVELIEEKQRELLNQRAREAVAEARRMLRAGQPTNGLALLEGFEAPEHPDVKRGIHELQSAIEAQRREEERLREEKRRAEVERQRRVQASVEGAQRALTQGDFSAALQTLRSLRDSDPDTPHLASLIAEGEAQQEKAELARRIAAQIRMHLDAATARLAAGDLGAAMSSVDAARALDAEAAEPRALAARIQEAMRAAAEAERREAEERRRREVEEWAIADAMARASRASTHELAIDALREALAVNPDYQPAQQLLAERQAAVARHHAIAAALDEAGRAPSTEASVAALRRAVQIDPQHQEAVRRLRDREADLERERAEAQLARERAEAVANAIRRAGKARSHQAALTALREALDIDPNHPEALRLFAARQAAWEAEQAAERRRLEIESARRDVESQLAKGAFDAAESTIAALEQTADGKRAAAPLRQRLERGRAAARDKEVSRLAGAARQALSGGDLASAREHLERLLVVDPTARDGQMLRREIENAAATMETRVEVSIPTAPDDADTRVLTLADDSPTLLLTPPPDVAEPSAVVASVTPATAKTAGTPIAREPRRPVLLYAGGAAAVIVVLLLGYRALRNGPAAPVSQTTASAPTPVAVTPPDAASQPQAPTSAPAAASTTAVPPASAPNSDTNATTPGGSSGVESEVNPLRALARQQLLAGAREQALSTATAGLKLAPEDRELRRILDDLAAAARAAAQRARDLAASAGSPASSSSSFQQGAAKQRQAVRLDRQNRRAESIREYWDATELFTKAVNQAPAAAAIGAAPATGQSPPAAARGAATPAVTPPSPNPASNVPPPNDDRPAAPPAPVPAAQPPAQTNVPASPVPQSPAQPSGERPQNEEPSIRAALRAYEQGFSALDAAAVQRVFPSVDARALAQGFNQMRAQRVQVVVGQISVAGSTATVTTEVRSHFEPKAGRATDASVNATFRLQKVAGAWVIVERR